jgi:hypothetical protein
MRTHLYTLLVMLAVTVLSAGVFIAPAFSEPPTPAPIWQVVRSAEPDPSTPDASTLATLVRTSLLTLNDAIRTGNFTVLRDTAAPRFRDANSAARLSAIFAKVMEGGLDLSPVAIATPQLTGSPTIDAKGMLQIRGYYALPTSRIDFALMYEPSPRGWRLYGISVNPSPLQAALPPAKQPPLPAFTTQAIKAR